jgi:phage-related protein
MIRFNLQFVNADSIIRYFNKYRKRQVISGTVTEFNLSYKGNADTKPIVSFVADQGGAITTCSLENLTTGENFTYTGTVPTNVALDIDCDLGTVKNSSVDKIADFSSTAGDFLGLVRGTNYFRFSGSNCIINIDYFERFF